MAYLLTDVPAAAHGALRVVPGSHRCDTLDRATVPRARRRGAAARPSRDGPPHRPAPLHARGDNVSTTETRRAFFYGYIEAGSARAPTSGSRRLVALHGLRPDALTPRGIGDPPFFNAVGG